MSEFLQEAKTGSLNRRVYEKDHHGEWARSLNSRVAAGGAWSSVKQGNMFLGFSEKQKKSKSDSVSRYFHDVARRYLRGKGGGRIDPNNSLIVCRYRFKGKLCAEVFELDADGVVRVFDVCQVPDMTTNWKGDVLPVFDWGNAKVWTRIGYNAGSVNPQEPPVKSPVTDAQIMAIAKSVVGKGGGSCDIASNEKLVLSGLMGVRPIPVDYKAATLKLLGRGHKKSEGVAAYLPVVDSDVERVCKQISKLPKTTALSGVKEETEAQPKKPKKLSRYKGKTGSWRSCGGGGRMFIPDDGSPAIRTWED